MVQFKFLTNKHQTIYRTATGGEISIPDDITVYHHQSLYASGYLHFQMKYPKHGFVRSHLTTASILFFDRGYDEAEINYNNARF